MGRGTDGSGEGCTKKVRQWQMEAIGKGKKEGRKYLI